MEERAGSKAAGYAVCLFLAVPLALLGLVTIGWNGLIASFIAVVITGACILTARLMRRRADMADAG